MQNSLELLFREQQWTIDNQIMHQIQDFMINFNVNPEKIINTIEAYLIKLKLNDIKFRALLLLFSLNLNSQSIISEVLNNMRGEYLKTENKKKSMISQQNLKKQYTKSIFNYSSPTQLDKEFTQALNNETLLSCNDYLATNFLNRQQYQGNVFIEFEHPSKKFRAFLEEKKDEKKQSNELQLYNNFLKKSFIKGNLDSKQKALKERFNFLENLFLNHVKSNNEQIEFYDLSIPTQTNSYAFGRILCDSVGKINEKSIIFDREDLAIKISLDISKINQYILFPNQHLVIEGVHSENTTEFICSQIIQKSYDCEISKDEQQLNIMKSSQLNRNKSILAIAASGPFTTADSLNYTPLQSLLFKIREFNPEIIILSGPFVEKNHKVYENGIIEFNGDFLTYQQLFNQIMNSIYQAIQNYGFTETQVIIVPSPDDKCTIFTSLPQPSFETESFPNFHFVTNPTQLLINKDIQLHVLNGSLMKDLLSSAIYKLPANQQNRIFACLSLCPIYPLENAMNLEYWEEFNLEDSPKIVILPSIITEFAYLVNETIFINPGFVCKANSPGTYAEITFFEDPQIPFQNRTRVDIKQI